VRRLVDAGRAASVYCAPVAEMGLGVNTRAELAEAASVLRRRIVDEHMARGVGVVDPSTTWIEPDVVIEADTVLHPFTILRGKTVVRTGAEVGPYALVDDTEVAPGEIVPPFTHLRPGGRAS
jgi:bifunctional UDP-N-acetylglucosamine pyrophosphorylase/glucosamine-1-phosphate N-acetyltransferase